MIRMTGQQAVLDIETEYVELLKTEEEYIISFDDLKYLKYRPYMWYIIRNINESGVYRAKDVINNKGRFFIVRKL